MPLNTLFLFENLTFISISLTQIVVASSEQLTGVATDEASFRDVAQRSCTPSTVCGSIQLQFPLQLVWLLHDTIQAFFVAFAPAIAFVDASRDWIVQALVYIPNFINFNFWIQVFCTFDC